MLKKTGHQASDVMPDGGAQTSIKTTAIRLESFRDQTGAQQQHVAEVQQLMADDGLGKETPENSTTAQLEVLSSHEDSKDQ